jgi:hypothetical protein
MSGFVSSRHTPSGVSASCPVSAVRDTSFDTGCSVAGVWVDQARQRFLSHNIKPHGQFISQSMADEPDQGGTSHYQNNVGE